MSDLTGRALGKYQIGERIGIGGMAEVYRAFQPGLERFVAVKVLHGFLLSDSSFLLRFRREAQAIASLRHPHIIQVIDFDVEDDIPYMVLELIEGITLAEVIDRRAESATYTPIEEILWLFRALCSAVGYAHEQGIIHRDLNPRNILLTSDQRIILTDFGIVRIVGGTVHTATGDVSGTPQYMSPEQSQGLPGNELSDLYALGIMLYELLAGDVPYNGDTPVSVLLKHFTHPVPVLRDIRPELPEVFDEILAKALAKHPLDRYQSADCFWRDLHRLHPGELEFPKGLFSAAPIPSKERLSGTLFKSQMRLKSQKGRAISRSMSLVLAFGIVFNVSVLSYIAYRLSQNRSSEHQSADPQAMRGDSNPISPVLDRGTRQLQEGNFRGAAQTFSAILESSPTSRAALLGRAEAMLELKEIEKAQTDILSAVKLAPNDPLPRLALARFKLKYEAGDQWDIVNAMISSVVQLVPNLPEGQFTQGWASLYFAPPAANIHVRNPIPCIPEMQAALSSGQASQAVVQLQKAVDQRAHRISYRLALSDALVAAGNLELAREHLDIILHRAPGFFPALQRNAVVNAFIGDYASAAKACTAIMDAPEGEVKRAVWLVWRAFARYSSGKFRLALADVEASLALMPDNSAAVYVRGLVEFQQAKFERALQSFQQVSARPVADYECPFLNPRNGISIHINIAQIYDVLGQGEKAVESYTRGIDANPKWHLGYVYRAEAYSKLGQFDLAENDLVIAKDLATSDEERDDVQAEFVSLAGVRKVKQAYGPSRQ